MTKEFAGALACLFALTGLGIWANGDGSFVYVVGETVIAYVVIVGGIALVQLWLDSRKR